MLFCILCCMDLDPRLAADRCLSTRVPSPSLLRPRTDVIEGAGHPSPLREPRRTAVPFRDSKLWTSRFLRLFFFFLQEVPVTSATMPNGHRTCRSPSDKVHASHGNDMGWGGCPGRTGGGRFQLEPGMSSGSKQMHGRASKINHCCWHFNKQLLLKNALERTPS